MNFTRSAFARRAAIAIVAAFAVALPQFAAAQAVTPTGTYNFVPARSTATPPASARFKSATMTFSPSGDVTVEGTDGQDKPVKATYSNVIDGKPHPVTGMAQYDGASFTRFSDTRTSYAYLKGKANVTLGVRVMSPDGNTLTFSEKTYNNAGKELSAAVMVFAKPGFEVAVVTPPPAAAAIPRPGPGAGDTPDEKAALDALGKGNDADAIRLFTQAIDAKSAQANIQYDLVARGIAFSRQNKNDEAMKDFDEAIKMKPEDGEAHFRRGGLWLNLKQPQKAIDDLTIAIKADEMNATAYYLRGYAYNVLTQDVPGAADKDKACMLDKMYCM